MPQGVDRGRAQAVFTAVGDAVGTRRLGVGSERGQLMRAEEAAGF